MSDTPTPALPKNALRFAPRPKVPPFARYEGTSAWRSNRRRVREYYRHLAAQKAKQAAAAPNA